MKIVACLTAWLGASAALARPLNVVATTSDLAAIARAVGGDAAVVRAIATGREDPHFLGARPSFILLARDADLWLRVGMDLEIGWEGPILDGARNPRIRPGRPGHLDLSAFVAHLGVPRTRLSRADGHVHPAGNPHYWLDPHNGRRIAAAIAGRMAELAPAAAAGFHSRALRFQQGLDARMFGAELAARVPGEQLWTLADDPQRLATLAHALGVAPGGWLAAMAPLRGARIVTYHNSWEYFAARFGMEIVARLEPRPGIPPTAAHLATVASLIRERNVVLVLQERFYSPRAAERVTAGTGVRIVRVANAVGGQPEAHDYPALFDSLVAALTATPEPAP